MSFTFIPTMLSISILSNTLNNIAIEKYGYAQNLEHSKCNTEVDTFTNKAIYISVDKVATVEGDQSALFQQISKITLDSTFEDVDTKFIIAFIVEPNGQITGERIIKNNWGDVGYKMIKIAKSFKWIAAECNGKKVATLIKIPLQICINN